MKVAMLTPQDLPFGLKRGRATVSWFHRNPKNSNQHCLYCGVFVGVGAIVESDKEHLINRRISAPGLMAGSEAFNFIFRACKVCNNAKAEIEDQIFAVTLLTSPGREDPVIDAAARAKAIGSYDRHRKQPIGEVSHELKYSRGPFTFGMVAGAQIRPEQIRLLSLRHIQGLFSLCTSTDPRSGETMRLLPEAHFGYFGAFPYSDWGNPQLLEIARRVDGYARIANITTADGFFRVSLRQGPASEPWFWALEWNQNFRVVGWIGDPFTLPKPFDDLPLLAWRRISETDRIRRNNPLLDSEEDLLFTAVKGEAQDA